MRKLCQTGIFCRGLLQNKKWGESQRRKGKQPPPSSYPSGVDLQQYSIVDTKFKMQQGSRAVMGREKTYYIGELLGQGQFGKVYRAFTQIPGESVAIKMIRRSKFVKNEKLQQLLEREMAVLGEFTHQNVIKLEELVVEKQEVSIVYEYCEGGTLEDRLPLKSQEALPIFTQLIEALSQAEQRGIIHRDIKPANILFKDGKVKLADWGFSRLLQNGETTCSFIGSPAYMAPQLLKGEEYTQKADIWSLGVVLYETLIGTCPWKSNSIAALCQEIKKNKLNLQDEKKISSFWKGVITDMLAISPQYRPSYSIIKSRLAQQSKMVKGSDEQKIMSCVFFLEIVQWSRKNLTIPKLDISIKLIFKNLLRLKHQNPHQSQLTAILAKQIEVVKNLRRKVQKQMMSRSKSPREYQNPEEQWQDLVKQAVKYVISELQLCYRQKGTQKEKGLLDLNVILDLIIFEDMVEQYLQKSLESYLSQLENCNRKTLLRLINFKLQIINKKYYQ